MTIHIINMNIWTRKTPFIVKAKWIFTDMKTFCRAKKKDSQIDLKRLPFLKYPIYIYAEISFVEYPIYSYKIYFITYSQHERMTE